MADPRADTRRLQATHVASLDHTPHGGEADVSIPRLARSIPPGIPSDSSDRYEIVGWIGSGSTADVFSLIDRGLGRQVAAKVMRPGPQEATAIRDFVHEAHITASMQHPSVLPVYDLDATDQGQVCFTMRRIDGETLQACLDSSRIDQPHARLASPNAIVTTFIAICHVVAYAHARGIIHQDIKPTNILLGNFGETLLLDWGSAVLLEEGASTVHALAGTPLYMSPEQARSEGASRASDIHAIGASLFHVLTLRLPTWSADSEEFWTMKRQGFISLPTMSERHRVPAALLAVALKAMAAQPTDRYASAQALLEDLTAYQEGMRVSAHRDSIISSLGRWYRTHRSITWVSGAAAVAVAVMSLFLIYEQSQERAPWTLVYAPMVCTPSSLADSWHAVAGTWVDPDQHEVSIGDTRRFTTNGTTLRMQAQSGGYLDLVYNQGLLGNVRVEWDYRPLVGAGNLNCFLSGKDRSSGYTFHVASWSDPNLLVVSKGANFTRMLERRLPAKIVAGHLYHFCMERMGRTLRLSIDDHLLADVVDADELNPPRWHNLGFDCIDGTDLEISNLRVWHQPLPLKTSPLAVATTLSELGRTAEALSQCDDLLGSYPGSAMEAEALLLATRCAISLNADDRAAGYLNRFERLHGDDRHLPYALAYRLDLAQRHHPDEIDGYRRRLVAFRGHPVLRVVLDNLLRSHASAFKDHSVIQPGEPLMTAAQRATLKQDMITLAGWSQDFGLSIDISQPFFFKAINLLIDCGEGAFLLEHFSALEMARTPALREQGRLQEALAQTTIPGTRAHLLMLLGRPQEVTREEYSLDDFLEALAAQQGPEAVVRLYPHSAAAINYMLDAGDGERVLSEFPLDQVALARSLIACGRYQELLKADVPQWFKNDAIYALGGYRTLMPTGNLGEVARCTMAAIHDGDVALATWGIERIRHVPIVETVPDEFFSTVIVPALWDSLHGRRQQAERDLAAALPEQSHLMIRREEFMLKVMLGLTSDSDFLAQPLQLLVHNRLQIAHALRADLHGDTTEAVRIYRQLLAVPRWQCDATASEYRWMLVRCGQRPRR